MPENEFSIKDDMYLIDGLKTIIFLFLLSGILVFFLVRPGAIYTTYSTSRLLGGLITLFGTSFCIGTSLIIKRKKYVINFTKYKIKRNYDNATISTDNIIAYSPLFWTHNRAVKKSNTHAVVIFTILLLPLKVIIFISQLSSALLFSLFTRKKISLFNNIIIRCNDTNTLIPISKTALTTQHQRQLSILLGVDIDCLPQKLNPY